MKTRHVSRFRMRLAALSLLIAQSFAPEAAYADPAGGVVVAGAATISQQGGVTNVMQTTDRAVINWNNFSVPQGHTANFSMPSVNSAVLNRVTALNNPSLINGAINSNGNVFLVNPSGVIVGATGVINTAGFTASALDIPNHEFMQGGTLHFRGESKASIVNNGTINTGAGGVALVGHTVINTGTITSLGSISLVSGGSVKLSNGGTYTQADLATINNGISETAGLIKNTGMIRAVGSVNSGGEVYLVNPNGKILHSGVIRATRATTVAAAPGAPTTTKVAGGKVQIEARNSTAEISGTVDVSGDIGGKVSITGSAVQLASATIDASGTNGGGVVQLGGGFQGKDTSITNALATSIDSASSVSVNAATGNAGTVIVWSDQATDMAGTITAQSTVSGDGGFVEVSGKELEISGSVNVAAIHGQNGSILIDPADFVLDSGNAASYRAMWGSGSVTIAATNSIAINADLYPTSGGLEILDGNSNSLTLQPQSPSTSIAITVNAAIRNGEYGYYGNSQNYNAGAGSFTITANGSIKGYYQTITANTIDLGGQVTGHSTINFYSNNNTIGIGSAAAGLLHFNDGEIGKLQASYINFNGSTINVNMSQNAPLPYYRSTFNATTAVNLQSFYGYSLSITSPTLSISGPIHGSDSFRYDQGSNRSLGLGDSATGNVVLNQAAINQISGFSQVELGSYNTSSAVPLDVNNADFSGIGVNYLYLNGSDITVQNFTSSNSYLRFYGKTLQVLNPIVYPYTANELYVSLYSGNTNVGIGTGSGTSIVSQNTIDNLGALNYSTFSLNTSGNINVNADMRNFDSVNLQANNINVTNVTVNQSIQFQSSGLTISNPIISVNGGSGSFYSTAGSANIGLGDGTTGTVIYSQATIDNLRQLGSGSFNISTSGNLDVKANLIGFKNNVQLIGTTQTIQSLSTDASSLYLFANDLIVTGPVVSTATNTNLYLYPRTTTTGQTFALGDGAAASWKLDNAEIAKFSGFSSFQLDTQSTSSVLRINADLTSMLNANRSASFYAGSTILQSLKSTGSVSLDTNALTMSGGITSTGTNASFDFGPYNSVVTTLGLGDTSTGTIKFTQAQLNQLLGFQSLSFSSNGAVDVKSVSVPTNLSIYSSSASADLTINGLTLTDSTRSLNLQGRTIIGNAITAGGYISIYSNQGIKGAGSSRMTIDRLGASQIGQFQSSSGDIFLDISNPGSGAIRLYASNGSVDVLAHGSTVFGYIYAYDNAIVPTHDIKLVTTAGNIRLTNQVYSSRNISINSAGGISENYYSAPLTAPGNITLTAVGDIDNGSGGYFDVVSNSTINATTTGLGSNIRFQNKDYGGTLNLGTITTNGGTLYARAIYEYGGFNYYNNSTIDATGVITGGASMIADGQILIKTIHAANQNVLLSASDDITVLANTIEISGGGNTTLRSMGDIHLLGSVQNTSVVGGKVNLIAGWDGSTQGMDAWDMQPFLNVPVTDSTVYGLNNGSIFIGDGTQTTGIAVGSRNGATNSFGYDLNLTGSTTNLYAYSQLGFRITDGGSSYLVNGTINVQLKHDLNAIAGQTYVQVGHVGQEYTETGPFAAIVNATISISTNGKVAFQGGNGYGYAQLGHGGLGSRGSYSGNITVDRTSDVEFVAGSTSYDYAQLGHGGFAVGAKVSGDISLLQVGSIRFMGGSSNYAYAQLGHGGLSSSSPNGGPTGNITIEATNDITFSASYSNSILAYAQLGHGGARADGNHHGDIKISTSGDLRFDGGRGNYSYAQLGHGGYDASGDYSGGISLLGLRQLAFTGGSREAAYAQLGHGGYSAGDAYGGGHNGKITVEATGDIEFRGGTGSRAYAQLGHGGYNADGNHGGLGTGDITLGFNALVFQAHIGENIYNPYAYVQLGHGGIEADGNHAGNITLTGNGVDLVTFQAGASEYTSAQLGHGGYGANGSFAGDIEISNTGGINFLTTSNQNYNYHYYSYAQLGHGGAYSLGYYYDPQTDQNIPHTAQGRILVHDIAGDLNFGPSALSGPQNSSYYNQANYVQLGHGGIVSQGNLSGHIRIDRVGNLNFSTYDSNNSSYSNDYYNTAQLGHGGPAFDGDIVGNIQIDTVAGVNFAVKPGVNTANNSYVGLYNSVQLGHGGAYSSGTILGGISLTNVAADIRFEITGTHGYYSYAQLGHGGMQSYQTTRNGAITIQGLGDGQQSIFLSQAADPQGNYGYNTVQIGHGGLFSNESSTNGESLGNITISDVENLTINNASTSSYSAIQIGHGGLYAYGTQTNDIEITLAGNLYMQGSASGTNNIARIGHHADYGAASGNISISVGKTATLNRAAIGHFANANTNSNVQIGVGQNDPQTAGSGQLVADIDSRFNSAPGGELRIYVPGATDFKVDDYSSLNNATPGMPDQSNLKNLIGGYSFGTGPYNQSQTDDNFQIYLDRITLLVSALGNSVYGEGIGSLVFKLEAGPNTDVNSIGLMIDPASFILEPGTAAGEYNFNIIAGPDTGSQYYIDPLSVGKWTVEKAPLDVTFGSTNKQYGTAVDVNALTTVEGIYFNDAYTLNYTNAGAAATAQVNGGTPYVTTGSITHTSNYYVRSESLGTITVTPAPLTITANHRSKVYGNPNFTLGTSQFTTAGLLFSSDTVTSVALSSAGAAPAADVGNYAITPSAATGARLGNYKITYKEGTLNVTPAPLTLTANSQYKPFGWTGLLNGVTGFTPTGLKFGQTIGSVSLSSAATPNTAPIGFYPINISNPTGGTANLANYSITLVPGIFVVGSNFGNYTYDLNDQGEYYWQTLPYLYGSSIGGGGINFSSSGQTTGDKPITETNSYDVFGGEQ